MSEWMGQTFAEETAKSKERDEYYATISSPEDLRENLVAGLAKGTPGEGLDMVSDRFLQQLEERGQAA